MGSPSLKFIRLLSPRESWGQDLRLFPLERSIQAAGSKARMLYSGLGSYGDVHRKEGSKESPVMPVVTHQNPQTTVLYLIHLFIVGKPMKIQSKACVCLCRKAEYKKIRKSIKMFH